MTEAASLSGAIARGPPPPGYDIFLSHNARDKPVVERLCERLAREGLEPWFDKWCLTPGGHWQEELASGLAASRACAVFVGPNDLGAWEREEIGVALSRAAADRSFRLFLVLLPGLPDPFDATNLSPFLSTRTWVDLRDGIERPDGFQALVCAIKGIPFGPARPIEARDDVCPYRGLQTFDEEHAGFFFGREADVQRLVEKLKASPYLAIVGPSGSGKSSLARAGLLPALRAGALAGSESWAIATLRPGPHPLDTLAAEVVALYPDLRAPRVRDDLGADPRTLRLLLSRSPTAVGSARSCLLVDQCEEAFTLCRDETERAQFLANLLHASAADGPVSIVLTLRADFYARLAAYPELAQQVAHQYLVGPLGASELREAITEPAQLVGLELEPGLVDQILDDVGDEPGTLPLLEHTLFELWQRRRNRMLTLEAYRETGGVEGALAKRADAIYASLEPEAQSIARRILLRLTQPGEGSEDTRRRAAMSELVTRSEEQDAVEGIVRSLADARLLTTAAADETGERSVEVSHEALIRGWPRLRAWLDENRAGLLTHRRLTEAAHEWQRLGRDDGGLFRGARLAEAREWGETNEPTLNELEREFLAASRRLDTNERRARTRRVRLTIGGLALALVLIGIGAGLAFRQSQIAADQRDEAATQRDLAYSGQLAANAVALLPVDPELGLLLAIESADVAPTAQARDALRQSLRASHLRGVFRGHSGRVWSAAFSPDGTLVVTAGEDGTARIWETRTRSQVAELRGHSEPVRSASFSPNSELVVTASWDGTARVWEVATGQVTSILRGHGGAVSDAAFDDDGDLVVTAGADGTARIWESATGSQSHVLSAGQSYLESASFGSQGELVATAGGDGVARVWDVSTERIVAELRGNESSLWSAALTRDGRLAATAGEDGAVRIWTVATESTSHVLRGHTEPVTSVAFSSDDRLVVTASQDLSARVWDVETEQTLVEFRGSKSALLGAAFSPDDRFVVTAHQDGTARLWEVESERRVATFGGHADRLKDVTFSPDGTLLAAASDDMTASVREAATGMIVAQLRRHRDWVESLAFSPDGTRVVTASFDRTARIWDAGTGETIAVLRGHSDAVTDAGFSPDGTLVATASADRTVRLWDVASGRTTHILRGPRARVDAVAFSPDGESILAASWDGKVHVWDTLSGAARASFSASDRPLRSAAFSPDGTRLLTAGDDSTARVWVAGSWKRLAELRGHAAAVSSASFSPDSRGTFVLTASEDGTALVFEVGTETLVAELHGPVDSLESAAFAPDSRRIATAGDDGAVRIYTCAVCRSGHELVDLARQRVSRKLTAEERAIYLSSREA
jgi:WD40 repeat protein